MTTFLPGSAIYKVDSNESSISGIERIAICTVGELFGGVERHVLGLISELATNGVSALLVLFHDGELAAQARPLGIELVILPNRNVAALATSRRLARMLEQRNINIVHVHGYKATVFCALARKWYPFAIVKTEHGLPEKTVGDPIGSLCGHIYHLLDQTATRASDATVCYVTKELLTHHGRRRSTRPAHVIPNGVASMDRQQFPRPPEMLEDWFNLVIVGRLELVKGHHLAISAVAAEGVLPNVHLHVLGIGSCEQELLGLANTLGIAHRVHLLGFRRNIYDYIAHCDALLMPSLHEGLPYTLLEAMALGVPVIASNVGGLAEVIRSDVTGLLVPPRDAAALANAIRRLHLDDALRASLGDAARQEQRTRYSLDAMTQSYIEVYRGVAHKHG